MPCSGRRHGRKANKNRWLRQYVWHRRESSALPRDVTKTERFVSWKSCCAFTESSNEKKADEGASACRRGDSDEVRSLALHSYVSLTHSIEEIYAHSGGGRRLSVARWP